MSPPVHTCVVLQRLKSCLQFQPVIMPIVPVDDVVSDEDRMGTGDGVLREDDEGSLDSDGVGGVSVSP